MSASMSPIPYTGSKSCIIKTILDVMPPHETYIEPCMGSAEVFFRKPPADREIINDYNGDLVNLFRVLQDNQNLDKVIGRLYLSLNAELLFRQNKELLTNTPNILDDLMPTTEVSSHRGHTPSLVVSSQDPLVLSSAIRLVHHMSNVFRNNALPPANPKGLRVESKRRKKLQQKRIALGHKPKDHEEEASMALSQ